MAASLLFLVPLVLMLFGAMVVVIVVLVLARSTGPLAAEVEAARRHGVITSGVALAVMVAVPVVLALLVVFGFGRVEQILAVMPLVSSAAALGALLVGELTWPRPSGATRSAVLADRSVRVLMTGGWARVTAASATLLVATILVGGLLAEATGRTVANEVETSRGVEQFTAGPFPGWHYGLPQAVSMLVVLGLLALVLRAADRRAAVVRADLETDRLLRRASAARAYRTAVLGLLLTAGGDLLLGGMAAHRVYEGPAELAATAAAVAGLAVAGAAIAALFVPAPRPTASSAVPGAPTVWV